MEQHLEPGHRAGGSGTSSSEKMPGPPNGADGRTGTREQRLVVAGESGFGEEYLAEIVCDAPLGHDPIPNPIVRVLGILRYPDQRAIMPPNPAHEVPPLKNGLVCRLPVLRKAEAADKACLPTGQAILQAIEDAATEQEAAILRRHLEQEPKGSRAVVTFTRFDLEYIEKHCAKGATNDADD